MSNQNMIPSKLRVDYSTAANYIGQDPVKPKSHFFAKLFSGLIAPVGAVASAVTLGPIGLPIAAGIFGLGRAAQDHVIKSQMKERMMMAGQPQPTNIQLPGLFESGPMTAGEAATDFIAPKSLESDITQVITQRDLAMQVQTHQPSFPGN